MDAKEWGVYRKGGKYYVVKMDGVKECVRASERYHSGLAVVGNEFICIGGSYDVDCTKLSDSVEMVSVMGGKSRSMKTICT